MATHSSTLAWRIPMDREAWWATVQGVAKSQMRLSTQHLFSPHCESCSVGDLGLIPGLGRSPGEGHGNPL